jgi:hypothetical protein
LIPWLSCINFEWFKHHTPHLTHPTLADVVRNIFLIAVAVNLQNFPILQICQHLIFLIFLAYCTFHFPLLHFSISSRKPTLP